MKLLNHTTKYFALLLIVLITVWAVIFYFAMLDEIYDSLDDGLENQKELIVQATRDDPSLLKDSDFGVNNFTIQKTTFATPERLKDRYRDTLMYMQNEGEYEPVRILESIIEVDNAYYKIKLITSMVEEDDQIETLFFYVLGLYLALIASIVLLNNFVLKKVWKPFYSLIGELKEFRIERDQPIKTNPTKVDEFNLLNESVERLTLKSKQSYLAQKEFIENAAHELQTPLAICINKLELMLEEGEMTIVQSEAVASVLQNLGRMTRLNKSLLMLSKIDNSQYVAEELIDFNALIRKLASDFKDFATHRDIEIQYIETDKLEYPMNRGLASVLISNLIKNAIVHGTAGKPVGLTILANKIMVKNFGAQTALNNDQIFKRFKKTGSDLRSTGLGLAIAKAVSDRYNLQMNYYFSDRHVFELRFPIDKM